MSNEKPLSSDEELAENAIMNMSVSERKYIEKDRDVEIAVKSIIIDALQEARKQAKTDGSKEQAFSIIEDIKKITGCESNDSLDIVESVEKYVKTVELQGNENVSFVKKINELEKQLKEASSETKEDFEHEKIITEFADDSTERLMKEIENLKQRLKEYEPILCKNCGKDIVYDEEKPLDEKIKNKRAFIIQNLDCSENHLDELIKLVAENAGKVIDRIEKTPQIEVDESAKEDIKKMMDWSEDDWNKNTITKQDAEIVEKVLNKTGFSKKNDFNTGELLAINEAILEAISETRKQAEAEKKISYVYDKNSFEKILELKKQFEEAERKTAELLKDIEKEQISNSMSITPNADRIEIIIMEKNWKKLKEKYGEKTQA